MIKNVTVQVRWDVIGRRVFRKDGLKTHPAADNLKLY